MSEADPRAQLEQARDEIERLQRDRAQAKVVLEALPDLMFVLDADGRHLDFHAPSRDRLFVKPEDFMGRSVTEVMPTEVASVYLKNIATTLARESPQRFEYSIDWGREGPKDYEARMVPSGPERVLVIVRDVTELNRARRRFRQSQKLESIAMLTSGIAHDFNNLLLAIMSNLDMARVDLAAGSRAQLHVSDAIQVAGRAAELVDQLLTYAGHKSPTRAAVDMSELVWGMAALLKTSVPKRVELHYELAKRLPPAWGDATQFRQIILNLVTNAAQAIGDGEGRISLSTGVVECDSEFLTALSPECDRSAGEYLCLCVRDTGPGVDASLQDQIFEPFFTTKSSGSGLGLAAVQGVLVLHEGGLKVESEPGEGASFAVYLPVAADGVRLKEPAEELERAEVKLEPPAQTRDATILVVDDERMVRKSSAAVLKHLGYKVYTASSGREAVEIYRENQKQIGCVLLDIHMPDMGGTRTIENLWALRSDLPVIVHSGRPLEELCRPPTAFLPKPYSIEDLERTIREVLGSMERPR